MVLLLLYCLRSSGRAVESHALARVLPQLICRPGAGDEPRDWYFVPKHRAESKRRHVGMQAHLLSLVVAIFAKAPPLLLWPTLYTIITVDDSGAPREWISRPQPVAGLAQPRAGLAQRPVGLPKKNPGVALEAIACSSISGRASYRVLMKMGFVCWATLLQAERVLGDWLCGSILKRLFLNNL